MSPCRPKPPSCRTGAAAGRPALPLVRPLVRSLVRSLVRPLVRPPVGAAARPGPLAGGRA